MVAIKSSEVLSLVDKIGKHYVGNVASRFIKPSLGQLSLESRVREQVESLTEDYEYLRVQGIHLDDLYQKILAMAKFISAARAQLLPNLKGVVMAGVARVAERGGPLSLGDKILAEMAVKNFPSNLQVLSDMVNELYLLAVEADKQMHVGKRPLFERMPELQELGHLLVD